MAFLTIGDAAIPCALGAPEQDSPELVGDEARTLSGRTRRVIRGWIRSWTVTTIPMPLADAQALALVLQSPEPLRCGGDLIGGTVDCYGSLTALRHQKTADGERAVVEFRLVEAAPSSPVGVLFSARRGLPAGAAFSRGSTAWTLLPDGTLAEVAANVPRIAWLDLDGDGVRETPTLLLEHASTNLVPNVNGRPANMSAFGTTPPTVQVEARQTPFGSECWAITFPDPVTTGFAGSRATSEPNQFTITAGLPYARTLWVAGDTTGIRIYHTGIISLSDMVPTGRQIQIGGLAWREFTGASTATASGSDYLAIYASTTSAAGKTIRIAGHQVEQAVVPSSLILGSPAPVTRAADALTFPWPHPPQAMTGYLRFIERGAVIPSASSVMLMRIGVPGGPNIWIGRGAGLQSYSANYMNATGVSRVLPTSPVPQIGDLVELLWRLYADGSVEIEQSINGGAPVVAGRSTAVGLAAAWNVPTLRLGGTPSGANEAPAAWLDAVVLKGSEWTIPQLRAFAT